MTRSDTRFTLTCGLIMLNRIGIGALQIILPVIFWDAFESKIIAFASFGVLYLPYCLGPVIGLCIDALDKRITICLAELTQGVCMALVVYSLGTSSPIATVGLLLVFGVANVFSRSITEFSLLPVISSDQAEGRAQKYYWTSVNFGYAIGPAIAGLVLALDAARAFFLAYLVASLLIAVFFYIINVEWPPSKDAGLNMLSLSRGFREFRRIDALYKLTITLFLYNVAVGALLTLLIFSMLNDFGIDPGTVGLLTSAMAVFGVAGSMLSDVRLPRWGMSPGVTFWLVGVVVSLGVLNFDHLYLFVGAALLLHAFEGGMNVTTMILRTKLVSAEFQGRVNGIVRSIVVAGIPLSAALYGITSEYMSNLSYAVAACLALCATVIWRYS